MREKYFEEYLAYGKKYEYLAQLIQQRNNVSVLLEQNGDNYRHVKYDFMSSDGIRYEVKTDSRSLDTNNFYVEFSKNDRPSGIAISEVDYYIITNTNDYYLIDIKILREIVICMFAEDRKGRTQDNSLGVLVPCSVIIKHVELLKNNI